MKRKHGAQHLATERVLIPLDVKTRLLEVGGRDKACRELHISHVVHEEAVAIGGRLRAEILKKLVDALDAREERIARELNERAEQTCRSEEKSDTTQ